VAAYPPADVRADLDALPRPPTEGVRWVPPDQWHVTLAFMGDGDAEAVSAALDGMAAEPALAVVGPRVLRIARRVVAAPVGGLAGLARAVGSCVGADSDRPFLGHITLGRLGRDARCPLVGRPVAALFDVNEVALVASVTAPSGARHSRLATYSLTGTGSADS
jgi:2'-5' RNA ligase